MEQQQEKGSPRTPMGLAFLLKKAVLVSVIICLFLVMVWLWVSVWPALERGRLFYVIVLGLLFLCLGIICYFVFILYRFALAQEARYAEANRHSGPSSEQNVQRQQRDPSSSEEASSPPGSLE